MKNVFILLLSVLLLNSCSNTKKKQLTIQEAIDVNAKAFINIPEINALSIGVYKKGKIYISHFGELEPGKDNTPNDSTFYEIASTTKTFTGTLLAQAIKDNKITLEDDIQTYLGESYDNLIYNNRKVKIKDVVTHSAGLPRSLPDDSEIWQSTSFDSLPYKLDSFGKDYTKENFLTDLNKLTLDKTPGEQVAYGNTGPQLIAHILEKVYGESYESLLKKYILSKAGMTQTKLELTVEEEKRLAKGFNDRGWLMPKTVDRLWSASGGLKSTLPDLMKYMQFQFDGNNEAVKIAHQIIEYENGRNFESGYFWHITKDEDEGTYYSVHGGAFGTQNYFMVFPEHNTGMVIVTNNSSRETPQRMIKLINGILEHIRDL